MNYSELIDMLSSSKDTHSIYFIIGFEPSNIGGFMNFLTDISAHLIGRFSMTDGQVVTAILLPNKDDMFLYTQLFLYDEINMMKHKFVKISGCGRKKFDSFSSKMTKGQRSVFINFI